MRERESCRDVYIEIKIEGESGDAWKYVAFTQKGWRQERKMEAGEDRREGWRERNEEEEENKDEEEGGESECEREQNYWFIRNKKYKDTETEIQR